MTFARFFRDDTATASVEFALILPLLVLLLFGGSEAGHFVWTQHKLTEGVRDGVRYASRLRIDRVCNQYQAGDPHRAGSDRLQRNRSRLDRHASDGDGFVPGLR
jgi:Flp pilus assembly pilin Flp